jgi:hypothetical protein
MDVLVLLCQLEGSLVRLTEQDALGALRLTCKHLANELKAALLRQHLARVWKFVATCSRGDSTGLEPFLAWGVHLAHHRFLGAHLKMIRVSRDAAPQLTFEHASQPPQRVRCTTVHEAQQLLKSFIDDGWRVSARYYNSQNRVGLFGCGRNGCYDRHRGKAHVGCLCAACEI